MRNKVLLTALFCCIIAFAFCSTYAAEYPKLDILLKPVLRTPLSEPVQLHTFLKARGISFSTADGVLKVGMVMKAKDESSAAKLAEGVRMLGGDVGSVFSKFVTARVPVSAIHALSELDSLQFAEAARRVKPTLNQSVPACRGDLAGWGINLSLPYKGSGVVVGAVDSGIDWTHPDFCNEDGSSRILAIWDQTSSQDSPPAGFSYGTEVTPPFVGEVGLDEDGHGTHVMSIAAGNGNAGAGMSGMAPAADLVFVKMSMVHEQGIDHMLDGVNYIFQKAESLGLPAAVNLSLGFPGGSHDGTSVVCQAIDALTGPGRIIVNSAGNEARYSTGYEYVYMHVGFEATQDEQVFGCGLYDDEGSIEIWYEPPGSIQVALGAISAFGDDVEHGVFVQPGESIYGQYIADPYWGLICQYDIDATETANPINGSRHIVITLRPDWLAMQLFGWTITVKGDCYFDAWPAESSYLAFVGEGYGVRSGDSRLSLTYPAFAKEVITVGSYVSKNEWQDVTGSWQHFPDARIGDISDFSSWGPTRRPEFTGPKPELCAPGQYIAAAFSAQALASGEFDYYPEVLTHDYYYALFAGTSMSSPHVTGAIALLLQNNPDLTPDDIEQILAGSAVADSFTGEVHNSIYGYGKLDIHGALLQVDPGSTRALGIDVQADYRSYERQDDMAILCQAANIGPERTVDFGMAVLDPDGALCFWPNWTTDYCVMRLVIPGDFHARDFVLDNIEVKAGSGPCTSDGTYYIFAAFLDPDTGQGLTDLIVSPVELEL